MNDDIVSNCVRCVSMIGEFYSATKYYFNEVEKDALINAIDCMNLVAGFRKELYHKYDGCDSHIDFIKELANSSHLTEQMRFAFQTASKALSEVFLKNNYK